MKELEQKIIRYLENESRQNHTISKMLEAFQMTSSSDFIRLNQILEDMEKEFLIFRNAKNEFLTQKQARVIEGRLSVNRMGVGFVDVEDKESYRIEAPNLMSAMNGDLILIQALNLAPFAKVIAIKERAKDTVVGTIVHNGKRPTLVLDDERLKERKIRLSYSKDFYPMEGLKVVCRITRYGDPLDLTILKSIGHKDDPGTDIASILVDHGIPLEFPDEVMEEVRSISQEVEDGQLEGRRDLRSMAFVTIDGDDSKDFDDAVYVEKEEQGFHLWVSIADVSSYVLEGNSLDVEAQQRSFSTYVVDRVVPMLPHELSNGICSLNPSVDRLALTCEMHISNQGKLLSYEVYPSVINSHARMTYSKVNRLYEGNSQVKVEYQDFVDLCECLLDCSDAIRHERVGKGAINFERPETELKLDEKGKPISIQAKRRGVAEECIEDCMIITNVAIARYLQEHKLPGIYRIHEEPSAKSLKEYKRVAQILGKPFTLRKSNVTPKEVQQFLTSIQDDRVAPVLNMLMLRTMQKARYDIHDVGHFGLAEKDYLHFTSPIRRYPDLIVHRMLWKYAFRKETLDVNRENGRNQEFAEHASIQERNCADAEYACLDMKKAEYMLDHIGDSFKGLITSITRFGIFVQLENTIEGLILARNMKGDYYQFNEDRSEMVGQRNGLRYYVGQDVEVRVLGADKQKRTIDFEFVGNRRASFKETRMDRKPRRFREEDSISYWDNPKDRKEKKPSFEPRKLDRFKTERSKNDRFSKPFDRKSRDSKKSFRKSKDSGRKRNGPKKKYHK